jgi:hypothetical protein
VPDATKYVELLAAGEARGGAREKRRREAILTTLDPSVIRPLPLEGPAIIFQ